jgi:ADP-heptose:LPS heptosyltransferase
MTGLPKGRILVIRGGAIGDFILTLPVLAAIRSAFPQTEITVLGYPRIAELALLAGVADELRSIESREFALFFNPKTGPSLPAAESAFLAGFDIIISYLYDPDRFFETNVARVSQAQFIAGPHRPDEAQALHATDTFLKPLERLAVFDADPVPRVRVRSGRERRRADGRPVVAVHPGSGSPSKNWPEDRWGELLVRLAEETDGALLLVGGEAEVERAHRLASRWPAARLECAVNEPLIEVAARLAGARAFVGHDSGITHLAAAVGVPGLVLWGPTRRDIWQPRSRSIRVLEDAGGLEGLGVDRVLLELRDLLTGQEGPQSA